MAKHKTAARKPAPKAAKTGKSPKTAVRATSSKPARAMAAGRATVKSSAKTNISKSSESKKKMPMKDKQTARLKPAAPHVAAPHAASKAAAQRPAAAKATVAKVAMAPARPKPPANANAEGGAGKAAPAKGFTPKLVASSGKPPAPSAKFPGKPAVVAPVKPVVVGKEPEFSAGDYVVYPTHGVGRIQGVENQEIAGTSLKVIVITFEKERMTLRVPVGKATNSGLRRLSSRKEMETALKTLKGRSRVRRMMWSRRAQEYEAKINSGDPVSIAEVVRDLYRNAGQPDQSYSERQIYQAALDRLARELAAVEKIDEMAAAQKLESVLRAA